MKQQPMILLHGNGSLGNDARSRSDWEMVLESIFLLIKGGGRWSVDYQAQK
jgi:hypothetical protein